jgi:hypothetical protein
MMMAVIVVVIMAMIVIRSRGFRISLHEGFDHLAQRILVERQMAGQQTGEPREDERLVGQAQVSLVRAGLGAVTGAAAERVGEELVHVSGRIIGRYGWRMRLRLQERAGMGEEARKQQLLQFACFFIDVAAHDCPAFRSRSTQAAFSPLRNLRGFPFTRTSPSSRPKSRDTYAAAD